MGLGELFRIISKSKIVKGTGPLKRLADEALSAPRTSFISTHMPDDEILEKQMFKNDLFRKMSASKNVPDTLKVPLNIVGGESLQLERLGDAEKEATKAALLWQKRMGMADYVKNQAHNLVDEAGDAKQIFGIDENWRATKVLAKEANLDPYMQIIYEQPGRFNLTPQQAAYVKRVKNIVDDVARLAEEEGVPFDKVTEFGDMYQYMPRVGKGKFGVNTAPEGVVTAGKIRPGARQTFTQSRYFQYVEDSIKAGFVPSGDPKEFLDSYIRGVFREVADARLGARMRKSGIGMPTDLAPDWYMNFGALKDLRFNPKDVARADRIINDRHTDWLKSVSNINSMLRTQKASLDFSAPFIQGLFIMFRRPKEWAEATARQFQFFAHPDQLNRWYLDNADNISSFINAGGTVSHHEYMESYPGIAKFFTDKHLKGVGEVYSRFARSFLGWGDVARVKMWEAMGPGAIAKGEGRELATIINKMTGILSRKELGIGSTQRYIENLTLFAPEYTRAGLSLVADIFRSGRTGAEARKAIAAYIGGGFAAYSAFKLAVEGKPPTAENFYPGSGKFLTVNVGNNQYVGMGGMVYGLFRLLGDTWKFREKEPVEWFKLWERDNPAFKFFYRRAAPFGGSLVDIREKKDFLGRPLESPVQYAFWLADKMVPMALSDTVLPIAGKAYKESLRESRQIGGDELTRERAIARAPQYTGNTSFGGIPFNLLGLRNFPLEAYDEMDIAVRDKINKAGILLKGNQADKLKSGSLSWRDLDEYQRSILVQKYPEFEEMRDKAMADSLIYRSPQYQNWYKMKEDNKATRTASIERAVKQFQVDGDAQALKEELNTIYSSYIDAQQLLEREFKEIYLKFKKDKKYNTAFDIALEEYRNTIQRDPALEDEFGDPRFREIDRRKQQWKNKYGQDYWDAAQEVFKAARDEPDVVTFLRESKANVLKPYYNIPKEYPDAREQYRKEHPQADAVLYFFGNVGSVMTPEAIEAVEQLKKNFNVTGLAEAALPRAKDKPVDLTEVLKGLSRLEPIEGDSDEIADMKDTARERLLMKLAEIGTPEAINIIRFIERGGSVEDIKRGGGRTAEFGRGNINLANRPQVRTSDGTISTVRSISIEEDGVEILIPTVSDSGKIMSVKEAIDEYHRTGKYLGKFRTVAEADKYAQQLHEDQAQRLKK